MMRPLGSGSYANVANAGGISGAQTATLTISSASPANSGDYVLVASNKVGTATSASGRLLVAQSNPPALIGQWVTGNQNDLQDKAGYYPAGLHDGYVEGSGTPTWVQGDVPPNFNSSLYSLVLDGASAVAITNTSQNTTLYAGEFNDTDYRIDYDNNVTNRFSVACWAKGFPSTAWSPFIGTASPVTAGRCATTPPALASRPSALQASRTVMSATARRRVTKTRTGTIGAAPTIPLPVSATSTWTVWTCSIARADSLGSCRPMATT
jgi:hypothetical protein